MEKLFKNATAFFLALLLGYFSSVEQPIYYLNHKLPNSNQDNITPPPTLENLCLFSNKNRENTTLTHLAVYLNKQLPGHFQFKFHNGNLIAISKRDDKNLSISIEHYSHKVGDVTLFIVFVCDKNGYNKKLLVETKSNNLFKQMIEGQSELKLKHLDNIANTIITARNTYTKKTYDIKVYK
jgi:hypothetical protein